MGTQESCTSFDHPVSPPSLCWSYRLCREAHSTTTAPLTAAPVFSHAFDILCNVILASSVDVVVAVLPQVQDVHSFMVARPGIQNLLELFLRCASSSRLGALTMPSLISLQPLACSTRTRPLQTPSQHSPHHPHILLLTPYPVPDPLTPSQHLKLPSHPHPMHPMHPLCHTVPQPHPCCLASAPPRVHSPPLTAARPASPPRDDPWPACRGERPLTWECAGPSQLLEFPAGAPVALHGGLATTPLSLTYSPVFAQACHAFAWGSVGYLHMLLHVLRLLCYLVIGHIIPAWHSGRCPWNHDDAPVTHKRLAHVPLQPLSQGNRPSARVPPEATAPLHIGIDPGLWVLSQLFRTSWVQVCSEPVIGPGSRHAQRGCLFCSRHAHAHSAAGGGGAGGPGTLASPHTAAMHEPAMAETVSCRLVANATASSRQASVAGNACITCTAAPLVVVQPLPGSCEVEVRGSEGQAQGGAVHVLHCGSGAAVVYPLAGRYGTRMHDNAPQEYAAQLASLLGDYLRPRGNQVRQLGSLLSYPEPHDGRGGGAAGEAAGMHVDLMQGTWGAAVQRAVVNQEVAGRQGWQAMAPGLLGGQRACFVVPALGAPEGMLRAAAGSLAQCQEARLFTGCHQ